MDWLAHNAGFVLVAYLVSGVCLLALIIGVIVTDRRRTRALKDKS